MEKPIFAAIIPISSEKTLTNQTAGRISKGSLTPASRRKAATVVGKSWSEAVFITTKQTISFVAQGEKPEIQYVNNVAVTAAPEAENTQMQKTEDQPQLTDDESQTEETDEEAQKKLEEEKKKQEKLLPAGTLKIGDVSITKTFAIGKGKLTVTATATAVYGDEKPKYTLVCKNAEGNLVDGIITATEEMMTSLYTQGAAAGTPFDIVVNLEGVSSENYELIPQNGSFEVGKRKVELALDAPEYTYDGKPHTPKVVVENLVGEDNVEADYEEVSQTAAGTYEIPVKGLKGDDTVLKNYELPPEAKMTFVVAQREVTLTAESSTYNGEKHTPKVVVGNLVEGDQLEAVYDGTPKTEAGTYEISVTGLKTDEENTTVLNNYKLPKDAKVTFTINPRVVEIVWGTQTVAQSEEGYRPDPRITNLVEGDKVTLKPKVELPLKSAGAHEIQFELDGKDKDNYKLPEPEIKATFTIQKAAQNVPAISAVAETLAGKNDGQITGVSDAMEYKLKDAADYISFPTEAAPYMICTWVRMFSVMNRRHRERQRMMLYSS